MTTDITKMSITELKALSWDQMAQVELCQANIKAIHAQIQIKNSEPKLVEPEIKPE